MVAARVRSSCATAKMDRVLGLRDKQRRARQQTPPPPTIGSALARFLLGSLAAIAVVVVGGFFALRSITIDEA